MTDDPHESNEPPPAERQVRLPGWIPLAIGVILVAMGALAIYTGWTDRGPAFSKRYVPNSGPIRAPQAGVPGVPGEPEPGASRSSPGETPASGPVEEGRSRLSIEGGRGGIIRVIRLSARRGVLINASPPDAVVYVNDRPIGTASQFRTIEQVWEFPPDVERGSFTIRLVAPGYQEATFVITADPESKVEIAAIEVTLSKP